MNTFARLFLVIGLLIISGCTPPPQATPAEQANNVQTGSSSSCPQEKTTVRFGIQQGETRFYQPIVTQFNSANPDMCVELVTFDDSGPPVVGAINHVAAKARQADVLELFRHELDEQTKPLFFDLRPFIDADPSFDLADYFPAALETIGPTQSIYFLPRIQRFHYIAYNKTLWAQRGLPAPDASWTWRDVLDAAEKLTHKEGGNVKVYGLSDINSGLTSVLYELAGGDADVLKQDFQQIDFTQQPYVAAVEQVKSLADQSILYLDERDQEARMQKISSGQIAMWFHWSNAVTEELQRRGTLPFEVGVIPMPPLDLYFRNNGSGYVINAGTLHQAEAWRWLSFLSKQPLLPTAGTWDSTEYPTRRSLVAQGGGWTQHSPAGQAALAAMAERPRQVNTVGRGDFEPLYKLVEALEKVVIQNQSAPQALAEAQAAFEQYRIGLSRTPQPTVVAQPVNTPVAQVVPPGATPIVFSMGAMSSYSSQLTGLAERFQQQNPAVFVQLRESGGSLADVAAQSDCFASEELRPEVNNLTLDLQPLIDADPTFSADDYMPTLLNTMRQGNALHQLPYEITLRTLVYNQTAFDQANLAYPTNAWTMDDLLRAAEQLTREGQGGSQYGFASLSTPQDLDFFLAQAGVTLLQGSGDTARPTFTSPQTLAALQQFVDLTRRYGPPADPATMSSAFPWEEAITTGKVGMWFDARMISSSQRYPFPSAIVAPPFGTTPPSSSNMAVMSGFSISARSAHSEACWQWLKFLSNEPSLIQSGFPARASVAASPEYIQQARPGSKEVYEAYQKAFAQPGAGVSTVVGAPLNPVWFYRAVTRAMAGANLEAVLGEAQPLTEQYLECMRGGGEFTACTRHVDPDDTALIR